MKYLFAALALTIAATSAHAETPREKLQREIFDLRDRILRSQSDDFNLRQQLLVLQNQAADPRLIVAPLAQKTVVDSYYDIQNLHISSEKIENEIRNELMKATVFDKNYWAHRTRERLDLLQNRASNWQDVTNLNSNFVSRVKQLIGIPRQEQALRDRKQCFSQSGQGLQACLDQAIYDSKSLIEINQMSMKMNSGSVCRYMAGFCEKANEVSRQVIAREEARIKDLTARKEIVRTTGDDPQKSAEISRLDIRIADLAQEKQSALQNAQDLKRDLFEKVRRNQQERDQQERESRDHDGGDRDLLERLDRCTIAAPSFCVNEANEVANIFERESALATFLVKALKPAYESLYKALVDQIDALKKAGDQITENGALLAELRATLEAKQSELDHLDRN